MNFLFISPNFPKVYSNFIKELKKVGFTCLAIGDEYYDSLNDELKYNVDEYCYVSDLNNLQWMKNTIDYLTNKYGHIDYIESNNEYWLENDAKLREYAHCEGLSSKELDELKYKSKMKKYFSDAGVKTARFTIVSNINNSLEFINSVGYPVFVKPDNGVGAAGAIKINDINELISFHESIKNDANTYIMEEFIDGYIISFDGIADSKSNVIAFVKEIFPIPIAEIHNSKQELYYFATTDIDPKFILMGKSVVKSFKIKKRCFHIEFFVLNKEKAGLGKKGDIIALEVNMRSPGGNTPNLISLAWMQSYYKIYAETMYFDKSIRFNPNNKNVSVSVSRRNENHYVHSLEDIYDKYSFYIAEQGYYSKEISQVMGDFYIFANFPNFEEASNFKDYFLEKN